MPKPRRNRFTLSGLGPDGFTTREAAEAEIAKYPSLHEGETVVELPEGPRTVVFDGDTGEAYDSSQCWESIADGDVLVSEKDRVVGILLQAWPTAVTEAHGHFHTFQEGTGWDDEAGYGASVALAREEMAKRGWS